MVLLWGLTVGVSGENPLVISGDHRQSDKLTAGIKPDHIDEPPRS